MTRFCETAGRLSIRSLFRLHIEPKNTCKSILTFIPDRSIVKFRDVRLYFISFCLFLSLAQKFLCTNGVAIEGVVFEVLRDNTV